MQPSDRTMLQKVIAMESSGARKRREEKKSVTLDTDFRSSLCSQIPRDLSPKQILLDFKLTQQEPQLAHLQSTAKLETSLSKREMAAESTLNSLIFNSHAKSSSRTLGQRPQTAGKLADRSALA